MPWWIWVPVLVIVLIVVVRFLRAPANYMGRSHKRLKQTEKIMELVERGVYFDLGPKHQRRLEDEVLSLAEAQKREEVTDDAMRLHRDQYTTIMQFQWEKLKDLRIHGGANLDAIIDAEEAFMIETQSNRNRS